MRCGQSHIEDKRRSSRAKRGSGGHVRPTGDGCRAGCRSTRNPRASCRKARTTPARQPGPCPHSSAKGANAQWRRPGVYTASQWEELGSSALPQREATSHKAAKPRRWGAPSSARNDGCTLDEGCDGRHQRLAGA